MRIVPVAVTPAPNRKVNPSKAVNAEFVELFISIAALLDPYCALLKQFVAVASCGDKRSITIAFLIVALDEDKLKKVGVVLPAPVDAPLAKKF